MDGTVDQKRAALEEVLSSGVLGEQSRLRALLSYLVEEEIAGRGDRLKAYSIATDVLGRGPGFDPSTDSIVRVEVARLRQALALHAASAGRGVDMIIEIPKGQYQPVFRPNPDAAGPVPADPPGGTSRGRVRRNVPRVVAGLALIVIGVFFGAFLALRTDMLAGLGEERPDRLRVVLRPTSDEPRVTRALLEAQNVLSAFSNLTTEAVALDAPRVETRYPETYRLLVSGSEDGGVRVELVHAASDDIVASRVIDPAGQVSTSVTPFVQLSPLQFHVASLVQISGVLHSDYKARGDMLPAQVCLNLVRAYFPSKSDTRHAEALECVEEELARGNDLAELHAALSYLYREEHEQGRNPRQGDAMERALEAARTAVRLDPYGATNYYSEAAVHYANGSMEAFLRDARTAIQLNPFEAEMVGAVAVKFAQIGLSGEALVYLRRAEELNPGASNWLDYAYFLVHFERGETVEAIRRAEMLIGSRNPLYVAAVVVSQQLSGNTEAAREELDRLRTVTEGAGIDMSDRYRRDRYSEDLIAKLTAALDAAADSL